MAKRTSSNNGSSRLKNCVWLLLRFLYKLLKLLLGAIPKIIDIVYTQKKKIPKQIQNTGNSKYQITKAIQFITEEKAVLNFNSRTYKLTNPTGKPLCLMFTWLNAQQKHVDRYVEIYLQQGFDVLTVGLTILDAMWPAKGTMVTSNNVVKFLHANDSAAPIMVHGFSSGALMWGHTCLDIDNDREKYQSILKRVRAQVWDSMVNGNMAQKGFTVALFPKSKFKQNVTTWFFKLFFKLFYNQILNDVKKAYSKFQNEPALVPALIFVSSTDVFGSESISQIVKEIWMSHNIQVTFKCWDKSPHVQLFTEHPEEYLTLLYSHMDQVGLLMSKEKKI